MIRRFVFEKYDDKYIPTLGTKISKKDVLYNDKKIEMTMMIWDVIGQQSFKTIHKSAFKGAKGAFMVCDLTRKETFDNLKYWVSSICKVAKEIPFIIIGNKNDLLNKEVEEEMLKNLAEEYGQHYIMTSAKTGENVEKAFNLLGSFIIESKKSINVNLEVEHESEGIEKLQDELIMKFCEFYGNDLDICMPIVRNQYSKCNIDFNNASKDDLVKVSDKFVEILKKYTDEKKAMMAKNSFKNILNR